jgi:phage terminase large subunit-like protein
MKKISWEKTREKYRGQFCVAGIDLSSVDDLTCCAYMFPVDEGRKNVDILMRVWCPQPKLYDKGNKYRDRYIAWHNQGWMEVTDSPAIDYDHVRAGIREDAKVFDMGLIGIDRGFQGLEFATKLGEDLGHTEKNVKVIICQNTHKAMGPICQEFERRLLEKQLNHGGHPILRFMADSVAVVEDPDGNKKPSKDKSQGKIDGIIAMLYALDRLMKSKPRPKLIMV